MKRISWQAGLLMAWPYGLFLALWLEKKMTADAAHICLAVWTLGTLVVCGLNVARAIRLPADADLQGLAVKLALVPFYVIVFGLGLASLAEPGRVLMLFLLDGLLLLTSSAYGLIGTLRAYRSARLTLPWALMIASGHMLFVLDVVSSVALFLAVRVREA